MKEIMEKIKRISFVSIDEIYERKDLARQMYESFDLDTKEVYKWYYFHQLCLFNNKDNSIKVIMWDYICGKNVKKQLDNVYNELNERRAKNTKQCDLTTLIKI